MKRVVLVTGANKGLGYFSAYEFVGLGYDVFFGVRNPKNARRLEEELATKGLSARTVILDVSSSAQINDAITLIENTVGRLDALVNNASVFPDVKEPGNFRKCSVLESRIEDIQEAMQVNAYGAFLLSQVAIPLMRKNNYGRIVNISSSFGQLEAMEGGWPGYRLSKVALNAITRIFDHEFKAENILINSLDPGWMKTDMGGMSAPISPADSAKEVVRLATLPDGAISGCFIEKGRVIPW